MNSEVQRRKPKAPESQVVLFFMAIRFKAFFQQIPALLRELCEKFGLVETESGHQMNREWTTIMVEFCLASVLKIAFLSAQINSELPTIFHLVSVSFSFAFASFFVSRFTGSRFPLIAQVLERVGMLFSVTGFFTAVTIPFPFWLKVTTWVIYVISMVVVFLCKCYFAFFDETLP